MHRRELLLSAARAGALGLGGGLISFPRGARAAPSNGRTLVVVYQRGGCDGLNTVVPYTDPTYYTLRPTIGIPAPGSGTGAALDMPGTGFGLHPALAPIQPLWTNGELAVLPAFGDPTSSRSHFMQQDNTEWVSPTLRSGWLNRYLQNVSPAAPASLQGVAMGSGVAKSLRGAKVVPAFPSLAGFTFGGLSADLRADLETGLAEGFAQDPSAVSSSIYNVAVQGSGQQLVSDVASVTAIGPAVPQNGAGYPAGGFGVQLRDLAHLIRSGVGVEVANVNIGGWDTHNQQGGSTGAQAGRLAELAAGLRAFHDDLGPLMGQVVVLVMTEFGRTARENGSRGTDHGRGSAAFAFGGGVRGGVYAGAGWPGLTSADLNEGRFLMPTVLYRDVYGELLANHLGVPGPELGSILPGGPLGAVGLFA